MDAEVIVFLFLFFMKNPSPSKKLKLEYLLIDCKILLSTLL